MNFKEYQEVAITTAKYDNSLKVIYPALGLCGEAGEVAEKVKKIYRDKNGLFDSATITEIKKELGDVLWYISQISNDLGINLEDVAQSNIDKLLSRKERNVINGNGDNR